MEKLPKLPGVYKITCLVNNRMYIGSTTDSIYKRVYFHRYDLKNNTHHSDKLQKAWNKYGEPCFRFEVIEICEKNQCLYREQHWIDFYDSVQGGFNCNPVAKNCEGRPVKTETRLKISNKLKGRSINYYRLAGHYKNATEAKRKEVYQYDLNGIFVKRYNSIKEAEETNNMNRGRISCSFYSEKAFANGFYWFPEFKGDKINPPLRRKPMSDETKLKISMANKK
jgi:hypothetical protein